MSMNMSFVERKSLKYRSCSSPERSLEQYRSRQTSETETCLPRISEQSAARRSSQDMTVLSMSTITAFLSAIIDYTRSTFKNKLRVGEHFKLPLHYLVAMIEVEIKAHARVEPLEAELKRRGAIFEKATRQADVYYNAPDRDFGVTDEAVRLRRQGDRTFLTYKGPKIDAKSKTRKEIEVEVSDFEKTRDILESLGFRKTLDVVKERRIYHYRGAEVCLDRIEGLGDFVELELQAEGPEDISAKRDALIALLRVLGVEGELIRESYLEMLLASRS